MRGPDRITPPAPTTTGTTGSPAPAVRAGLLVVLMLGGLTAMPALSMDMYLPALPAAAAELHSSAAGIQLTLTTCLAGLALGQLIVGPLSDRWGRRRPLLAGMAVFVVATVACALAPDVPVLMGFRLVQGLAGAAGVVIARAVVRDMYDGLAMARFFSSLMLVSGIAPIAAPLIGGQVLRVTDWRGVFVVLAVVGAAITAVVARKLPETLPPGRRHSGGFGTTVAALRGLLADRAFSGYLLAGSFGFAALFAYVSASSFVMQEIHGASPQTFSLLFGANALGMITVGQINGRLLVGRVALEKVLGTGLVLVTLASTALLLMALGVFGEVGLAPMAAGFFALMSSLALVLPNANALGLMRARDAAGSASALLGTSAFLTGAIASPLVGVAGEHTAVPMAVTQVTCSVLAGAAFVLLCVRGPAAYPGG
ncbi:multidrug effflux MFS transporter [Streptomyces smaragdinus]|uniref:multidrug effflux MFS transporter n=1 Tax=Streptomyces smaragdinus TaxID=2585196 RepID=UPI00129521B1|nr:multidrug effflux MFS transporter [Streptomyces smaragdinus]